MYLNIINIVCDCWLIKVNLRDICLPHQHDESKRTLKQKLSKAKKRENIAHQQKALREAETELAAATVGSIVLPSLPPSHPPSHPHQPELNAGMLFPLSLSNTTM